MKELLDYIQSKAENKMRFIISIDGRAASGKSTLAAFLKRELQATVFHMDDYFLPSKMKTAKRLSIAGGNVNHERLKEEVLDYLDKDSVEYKKYNCMTEELETMTKVLLSKFIVIEGVYSQQKKLKQYYDLNIFTEISKNEQYKRLENRNPALLERFIKEWLPLEEDYFKEEDIERNANYRILVEK